MRLAVTEAVAALTGLSSDRVTVGKMAVIHIWRTEKTDASKGKTAMW